jgi:hypothetical protein
VDARFLEAWEPRIGRDATLALRRRGYLVIFRLALVILSLAVFVGLGRSGSDLLVVGLILVGLSIDVIGTSQNKRRLAAALTSHVGFPVASSGLPPFKSPEVFDQWLAANRAGAPPKEPRS